MTAPLTIYGDRTSGNCLKVKWVADLLQIPSVWRDVDVRAGGTRTPEMLALNPAGRVPFVVLPDGAVLSESNAIILHLAEGSALVPAASFARARMLHGCSGSSTATSPTSRCAATSSTISGGRRRSSIRSSWSAGRMPCA